ncbi:MAG: hypothetical protein K0U74_13560 [Alphaproteobacteria bacterium]|nr:hypothetical protein [Alphaproteobacteria bacterium]
MIGEFLTHHTSDNQYDWLGPGVYFWQSNPKRAALFAKEKKARDEAAWDPVVVGAVVELGQCLDLTTEAGIEMVRSAHSSLEKIAQQAGDPLPTNSGGGDFVLRKLDCAVIRTLHAIRQQSGHTSLDTVLGVFQEGAQIYAGAGFRDKTHIQISVCNPAMIKGVFRVDQSQLK